MAKQPQDAVVRILQQIQTTLADHGRDLTVIKGDLRRQGVRMDELCESSMTALGLASHANVRHNSVQEEIDELKRRVEQLEEKL